MKITIVCDVLGDPNNGTSIAAYNLINFMLKKGHQVHVVCPDQDKKMKKGFYVVPTRDFGIFNGYVENNGVKISKRDDMILMRAIKGSDIVHIMMPFGLGKRSAYICKRYNIPCTAGFHVQAENFTSHFFVQNVRLANWAVYRYFFKRMYSMLDAIHYPSQFIKDEFEKNIGFETVGYIISNGISKDFYPKPVERPDYLKDRYLILFSGRYCKEKAHRVLIRALKYSKYRDKIQLIFAGRGPQEKALKKLAKKEGLKYPPIFQFFDHRQIVGTIRMCDLYVHPSNIEIEGISALEAIAGGLVPVVSNGERCATKNFALTPHNLFKANDAKDLASKIDYWFDHPKEKAENALLYRDFIKKMDREYCMEQMEKMFFEVIDKKKHDQKQR
ncbi:MAG: glycosyltransferase [Bacilli bacterium]|nr:glycosyltransferase [Bacilli bacterium]